jgi:hypothetical protein
MVSDDALRVTAGVAGGTAATGLFSFLLAWWQGRAELRRRKDETTLGALSALVKALQTELTRVNERLERCERERVTERERNDSELARLGRLLARHQQDS